MIGEFVKISRSQQTAAAGSVERLQIHVILDDNFVTISYHDKLYLRRAKLGHILLPENPTAVSQSAGTRDCSAGANRGAVSR